MQFFHLIYMIDTLCLMLEEPVGAVGQEPSTGM